MFRWRGDHGKDKHKLFPANYVQIMDGSGEGADMTAPNEAVLNLSGCLFGKCRWATCTFVSLGEQN